MRRRGGLPALIAVALAVLITGWWQRQGTPPSASAPASTRPVSPATGPSDARAAEREIPPPAFESRPAAVPSDLRFADEQERQQFQKTLALIERGGPFPHKRDGVVFENREGRLPRQRRGYYREYTVPTPGARNRGARRIVRGEAGETWYSRDHYRSFVRADR